MLALLKTIVMADQEQIKNPYNFRYVKMFSINVTLKWRKLRHIRVKFVVIYHTSGFVISGLCAIQITVILPEPKSILRYSGTSLYPGSLYRGSTVSKSAKYIKNLFKQFWNIS